MEHIDAEKIIYNDQLRIRLHFTSDKETIALIRTLPGCRWSPMMQSWHIAADSEIIDSLNRMFPGKVKFWEVTPPGEPRSYNEKAPERRILITPDDRHHVFVLKFYYDRTLTELIRTMPDNTYDPHSRQWIIDASEENKELLLGYLGESHYKIVYGTLNERKQDYRTAFGYEWKVPEEFDRELRSLNYSDSTRKQYLSGINKFLNECGNDPDMDSQDLLRCLQTGEMVI